MILDSVLMIFKECLEQCGYVNLLLKLNFIESKYWAIIDDNLASELRYTIKVKHILEFMKELWGINNSQVPDIPTCFHPTNRPDLFLPLDYWIFRYLWLEIFSPRSSYLSHHSSCNLNITFLKPSILLDSLLHYLFSFKDFTFKAVLVSPIIPTVMVWAQVGKELPDMRQNERKIKFIRVGDAVRTVSQLKGEPTLNKGS